MIDPLEFYKPYKVLEIDDIQWAIMPKGVPKMSDEIKITKDNLRELHDVLKEQNFYVLADCLKKVFPKAFEPKERKLELTEEHLGEIWEIDGNVYWIIQGLDLNFCIQSLVSHSIHYGRLIVWKTCKFLAPSLQAYLEQGGKIY